MSKLNVSDPPVRFKGKEKAVAFITDDDRPFSSAMIGITYPFPDYEMHRPEGSGQNVLEYVTEGRGEILLDGRWRAVSAGDIYILRGSDRHDYRADPKHPWKKLWINYVSDYISAFFDAYKIKSGIYHSDTAKKYFETLQEHSRQRSEAKNVCFEIADCVHKIIEAVSVEDTENMTDGYRIKEALNASVYKKLSLDELAEQLHISRSNVIRVFKKSYGVPPYEYLIELKLSAAEVLLSETLMSIKEIAERLQISDEHYFSTLFFKRVGMRPRDYRAANDRLHLSKISQ